MSAGVLGSRRGVEVAGSGDGVVRADRERFARGSGIAEYGRRAGARESRRGPAEDVGAVPLDFHIV
jgi:hypothetical protein